MRFATVEFRHDVAGRRRHSLGVDGCTLLERSEGGVLVDTEDGELWVPDAAVRYAVPMPERGAVVVKRPSDWGPSIARLGRSDGL